MTTYAGCDCDTDNPACRCDPRETTMSDETHTSILDAVVPNTLIDRYVDRIMTTVKENEMSEQTTGADEALVETCLRAMVDAVFNGDPTAPAFAIQREGIRRVIAAVREADAAHAAPDEATVERVVDDKVVELAYEHWCVTEWPDEGTMRECIEMALGLAALPAPPSLEGLLGERVNAAIEEAHTLTFEGDTIGIRRVLSEARAALAAAQEGEG